jgi:hypothetical protein
MSNRLSEVTILHVILPLTQILGKGQPVFTYDEVKDNPELNHVWAIGETLSKIAALAKAPSLRKG